MRVIATAAGEVNGHARRLGKAQMAGKQGFAVVFEQGFVAPHAAGLPAAEEGEGNIIKHYTEIGWSSKLISFNINVQSGLNSLVFCKSISKLEISYLCLIPNFEFDADKMVS